MLESRRALITGGAGFIGINLANRLLSEGHQVTIFDNLSRSGCKVNLRWLNECHGENSFRLISGDVTDFSVLSEACQGMERVYHLAGQVAVTTSVQDPRRDFMENALGTINALEAARLYGDDPVFIYSSTNKVYGDLRDVEIIEGPTCYRLKGLPFGIPETQPVDFHSPYGCSKGAGDQYTRDYARIYGLRSVVLRQSCIYGPHQYGIEDQGWVAWFMIAAMKKQKITIYGDGKQVRDILFIDDLIDAYEAAVRKIDLSKGQIFNIGGGPENTLSIWSEFGSLLEDMLGRSIPVEFHEQRPGDQKLFISDIRKAEALLGWKPQITIQQGLRCLYDWISNQKN
jgi:CDP-paratose 2-epimerase